MTRFLVEIELVAPEADTWDIFNMIQDMFDEVKQRGKPFITNHYTVVNTTAGEKMDQDDYNDIEATKQTERSFGPVF